jgi:hypothetical protein
MPALTSSPALADFPQENPVGEFAGHTDVGSPRFPGAAYDAARQEYILTAAAANGRSGRDAFQFAWKKMQGDSLLRARAAFAGRGAVEHRKLGWMARPSLEADAPCAACARHGADRAWLPFGRARPSSRKSPSRVEVTARRSLALPFWRLRWSIALHLPGRAELLLCPELFGGAAAPPCQRLTLSRAMIPFPL